MRRVNSSRAAVVPTTSLAGVVGPFARVHPLEREGRPVVRPSQPYSCVKHMLLSAYGSQWKQRIVAMFTLYIDDSGTSQDQPMAIAAGIVIPAVRLELFEREWNRFLEKYGSAEDGLHSSECFYRNPKSPFAAWSDERVAQVFSRVLQIFQKYA